MKKITYILTFFLITYISFAQDSGLSNVQDSLVLVIKNDTYHDSLKISAAKLLLLVTWAYEPKFYSYIKISDSLAKLSDNKLLRALVNLNYGQYYIYIDKYDSARFYLNKAYEYYSSTKNYRLLAASCGEMGNSYCLNGDYRQCLKWYLKALENIYKVGDTPWIAVNLNNIGSVYYYLSDTTEALNYYKQAYELYSYLGQKHGIALTTNNIGVVLYDKGALDSAKKYFFVAIKNAKEAGYREQLAESLNHLASIYLNEKLLDSAFYLVNQSIEMVRYSGDYSRLADNLALKAEILVEMNKISEARKLLDSSFIIANKINSPEIIKRVYLLRYVLDTLQGQFKSALYNFMKYSKLKDSLSNNKIKKDIANLEAVYELELAEKENQLLKIQQERQKLIIERHRIIFISIAIFFLLIFVFVLILIRQNKKIRRYNEELEKKNIEISQKNTALAKQKEEIIAQKKEIEKQNIELIRSQRKIQESIYYAYKIQKSLLPSERLFHPYFKESFILFIPQQTVSGDFYWADLINEKFYFAVGDCTGHGVPGAFISMMVFTVLKEITIIYTDYSAAEILSQMRETIKKVFYVMDKNQITDGADIALVILDTKTYKINFAGAYRPLFLIHDAELIVFKGDKQPVGSYLKEKLFTDHYIQLEKNDIIYLFTDGYYDQIRQKDMKKFMLSQFKKLLLEIHNLPLEEQKIILEKKFYEWKQDASQIDDITILGLKV